VDTKLLKDTVDKYPKVPSPLTVDWREDSRRLVDTKLLKDTVDKYPKVPNPLIVDWRVKSKNGVEIRVVVPADK
jgi:hypothetical protein